MTGGLHSDMSGCSDPVTAAPAPVRTCIGCRARAARTDLLRVVSVGGRITPDPRCRLPGRGAWVHPACVETAERRRAFGRALRVSGEVDLGPLRTWIAEHATTRQSDPGEPGASE